MVSEGLLLFISLLLANGSGFFFCLVGMWLEEQAGYWLWVLFFVPSLFIVPLIAMLPAYLFVDKREDPLLGLVVLVSLATYFLFAWTSSIVIVPKPICHSTFKSAVRDSDRCSFLCFQGGAKTEVRFSYKYNGSPKTSAYEVSYTAMSARGEGGPYSVWLEDGPTGEDGQCIKVLRGGRNGLFELHRDARSTRDSIIGTQLREPASEVASYRAWTYAILVLLNLAALILGIMIFVHKEAENAREKTARPSFETPAVPVSAAPEKLAKVDVPKRSTKKQRPKRRA